jgi:hypothetical protein
VKALLAGLMCGLLLASSVAPAQPAIKQQPVQFKKGESGATIKGSLKGDQIIDYTLRASAGQVMVVHFKPTNPSAYFNVMPPGSDEAIFIGSSSGNEFSGDLKASGVYTIRVYLMRNAARRNESVNYTLDVGVSGAAKPAGAAAGAATAATNAESDYRFLHYANRAFTTNVSSKLAWQRKDDNWWISVNGREFYFIPDALINGG